MIFDTKDQRLEDILDFAGRMLEDVDYYTVKRNGYREELHAYERGLTWKQWQQEKANETQSAD